MGIIREVLADSRSGTVSASPGSTRSGDDLLKDYNEVLFGKLEKKMVDLERANRDLQESEGNFRQFITVRTMEINGLLSNAVKYSSLKERSVIEVSGALEENRSVYHVRDSGVGFDMQYADKLFGVFQRLHGPDQFEGTGVGLAIVQRIVRRHGGRVWADARPGEGALFGFALPAGDANG